MRILLATTLSAAFVLTACGQSEKSARDAEAPAVEPAEQIVDAVDPALIEKPSTSFVVAVFDQPPLGLPPVPEPLDNPTTAEKVRLGEILFNDARFSATGEVSCATCHKTERAFTDSPLSVSEGVNGLTGTRNAPTVLNAAYMQSQFWDGRRLSLEAQSLDPFLNPVEMALPDHQPILDIVRNEEVYGGMFDDAFGVQGSDITIDHVAKAIGAFERVVVSGNSPFDRFYFGGEEDAISNQAKRGLEVFLNQGRCVSCHTISQTHALFTDNKFHNLGIGFQRIEADTSKVVGHFLEIARTEQAIDEAILGDVNISEIGRFVVSRQMQDIGQFKTSTLRNIAATAPYMHDGSLKTLKEVVEFYNTAIPPNQDQEGAPNSFQSGGIKPLDLTDQQIEEMVAFLETLTSPEFAEAARLAQAGE